MSSSTEGCNFLEGPKITEKDLEEVHIAESCEDKTRDHEVIENDQELNETTNNRTSEEATSADDKPAVENTEQPLSKKQRKRLLKQQKYEEIKKMRTIKRKEKRKLKREQREQEGNQEVKLPSDSPIIKYRTMDSPDAFPLKVAIDLSFDNLMSDKDICKLTKQLQRCYSLNRRSQHPLQLYFTSFGDKCKERFDNDLKGHYVSWDVHIKHDYVTDVFPKENIIYLSSDSPNVLNDFDMSKTYVIGGLVDHNHHKGLCYNMAIENGIDHAQLPITEYFKLTSRTVMTVNQVYEIIMYYVESKDWRDAFTKVMPQRKITPKVRRKGKCKNENERKDGSEIKPEDEASESSS